MAGEEEQQQPKPTDPRQAAEARANARRNGRGNFFGNLVPGPSREQSELVLQNMENLARGLNHQWSPEDIEALKQRRADRIAERQAQRDQHQARHASGAPASGPTSGPTLPRAPGESSIDTPPSNPAPTAITDETAAEAIDDEAAVLEDETSTQTEILRAILSNSISTQEDARATAKNSRTFAWAGIVIAFLTLVATAVTLIK